VNQRRDDRSSLPTIALVVVFALVVGFVVYWFVIRDDSNSPKKPSTSPTATVKTKTFNESGIPFTFEYPGNFVETKAPKGFIWISGIGLVDLIDIKRVSLDQLTPGQIRRSIGRTLAQNPVLKIVGEGSDQYGGIDMVRYTVTSSDGTRSLRSQLFLFGLGGDTWQFECQSQASAQSKIDAACAQALASFKAS